MADDRRAVLDDDSALADLLGAYFHQDWRIEGRDPAAVIQRFVDENPPEVVRAVEHDLAELLAQPLSEADLATLHQTGFAYSPTAAGSTYREWLEFIQNTVRDLARD
jgi:hypothetical protein